MPEATNKAFLRVTLSRIKLQIHFLYFILYYCIILWIFIIIDNKWIFFYYLLYMCLFVGRWKHQDVHDIVIDCARLSLDAIEGTREDMVRPIAGINPHPIPASPFFPTPTPPNRLTPQQIASEVKSSMKCSYFHFISYNFINNFF
jgi:hypothetical protein